MHAAVLREIVEACDRCRTDSDKLPNFGTEMLVFAIQELEAREKRLRDALERLRDCDWVISLPDRMDAVREVARAALNDKS